MVIKKKMFMMMLVYVGYIDIQKIWSYFISLLAYLVMSSLLLIVGPIIVVFYFIFILIYF